MYSNIFHQRALAPCLTLVTSLYKFIVQNLHKRVTVKVIIWNYGMRTSKKQYDIIWSSK